MIAQPLILYSADRQNVVAENLGLKALTSTDFFE